LLSMRFEWGWGSTKAEIVQLRHEGCLSPDVRTGKTITIRNPLRVTGSYFVARKGAGISPETAENGEEILSDRGKVSL